MLFVKTPLTTLPVNKYNEIAVTLLYSTLCVIRSYIVDVVSEHAVLFFMYSFNDFLLVYLIHRCLYEIVFIFKKKKKPQIIMIIVLTREKIDGKIFNAGKILIFKSDLLVSNRENNVRTYELRNHV